MNADITIAGTWRRYTITARTPRAARWMKRHLVAAVRLGDAVIGGDRSSVASALRPFQKLRVVVNGVDPKLSKGGV